MKRVKLIYNPNSGEKKILNMLDDIIMIYQENGYELIPHRLSNKGSIENAFIGLDDTYNHLLIAGGDGTVDLILNSMKINNIEILKYKVPYKISDVIADAFIAMRVNNQNYIYFVEVENTKKFDLNKYEKLYYSRFWKEMFPVFPSIIVITDKKINMNEKLNIIDIKLDLSNLKEKIK